MFDPATFQGDFRTVATTVSFTGQSPAKLVGANSNRVAIYFGNSGNVAFNLYIGGDTARSPALWQIATNGNHSFTWVNDGYLTTLEWWAAPTFASSATPFSVLELIYQPQGFQ